MAVQQTSSRSVASAPTRLTFTSEETDNSGSAYLNNSISLLTSSRGVIKSCFVSVLSRCVDKLNMLAGMYASVAALPVVKEITYLSTQERYGGVSENNYDNFSLGAVYTDVHKFQKEVALILYLLELFIEEARKWGTVTVGNEAMRTLERMRKEEDEIMDCGREKQRILNSMKSALRNERDLSVGVMHTYNSSIRDTHGSGLDEMERVVTEVNYVKMWEEARYEQNLEKLQKTEAAYRVVLATMQWKINLEQTCHEQLEKFILESQQDYMDNIQYLMDSYDAAFEQKETQLYDLKQMIEKQRNDFESLNTEYKRRAQLIEELLEMKRKKREEKLLLAQQTAAVVKIQCWWREVMIRRKNRKQKKNKGKRNGKGKKR
ncbi:hypothetical protein Zmor_004994 [Zophobas morio]|uniref:Dynein regulatory complex protein 10 n=1 Tax=Zophobas morio TaxID=2755281 RepID=A0AA38IVA9_9CUCU|nr:hypothetical protein Zmor_004994 [Zophobas morio]